MKLFAILGSFVALLIATAEAGCSCNTSGLRGTSVSNCASNDTHTTSCDCWTGCGWGGCWHNYWTAYSWTSEIDSSYCWSWATYNEKCRNYYWKYSNTCTKCNSGYYRASSSSCKACSSCASGKYRSGGCSQTSNWNSACTTCKAKPNCGSVTCTNSSNSVCTSCNSGHYVSNGSCYGCRACMNTQYETTACTHNSNRVCTACNDIAGCKYAETCTTSSNQQCSECESGRYLVDGTKDSCPTCTQISNCASTETCSSSTNSQCATCKSGYYLVNGTKDSCPQCTQIANCDVVETCTSSSNSKCSRCKAGFYVVEGTMDRCEPCKTCGSTTYDNGGCSGTADRICTTCNQISNCNTDETCTTNANQQCHQCKTGFYLSNGTKDSCPTCTAVANCTGTTSCSAANNSQCTKCATGYWLQNGTVDACRDCKVCSATEFETKACGLDENTSCANCIPVANCQNLTTCTTAHDGQCDVCQDGYYLVEGDNDECRPCRSCPVGTEPVDDTCTGTINRVCRSSRTSQIQYDKFYQGEDGRPHKDIEPNGVFQFRAQGAFGVSVALFNKATKPDPLPENYEGATEITLGVESTISDCLGCGAAVTYTDHALVVEDGWRELWIHVDGTLIEVGEGIYTEGASPVLKYNPKEENQDATDKNLDLAVFTFGYYGYEAL